MASLDDTFYRSLINEASIGRSFKEIWSVLVVCKSSCTYVIIEFILQRRFQIHVHLLFFSFTFIIYVERIFLLNLTCIASAKQ